jgi:hypothetical protein
MMIFTLRSRADGKAYTLSGDREALPHALWFVDLENAIAYAKWCAQGRDGAVTLLNADGSVLETTSWKAAPTPANGFSLAMIGSYLRAALGVFHFAQFQPLASK